MAILEDLVASGRFLHSHSLVIGSGGNISARESGDIYIKKSGVDMSSAAEKDYLKLELSGTSVTPAGRELSSETPLHISIYKSRADIFAVAHTHSPYAIAFAEKFSVLESPSYEFDCMIGKSSLVLPYILPGSPQLAEAVAGTFSSGHNAVLLRRHGVVSSGKDIFEACLRALAVERAAMVLLLS